MISLLEQFPQPDLAESLFSLYFTHTNYDFPLLHRPTFERQWREKLYLKDIWFTALCLIIFAVASRWSEDERVLADAIPRAVGLDRGEQERHRAGWTYLRAGVGVHRVRRSVLHPPCLFEVQTFSVSFRIVY
jgi:hypothetical protein